MRASSSRGRRILRLLVLGILFGVSCGGGSCGGGGGCGGCGDGTYEFPLNDPNRPDAIVQDEAARARITQRFLDFIKPQLPGVIRSQLGAAGGGMYVDANDVLHIPLPDTDLFDIGVAEARMRSAEALLWLSDLDQRLDVRFEQPDRVKLTITNLRLGVNLDLKEDALGTTSSCPIEGDLGPMGPGPLKHAAEISIEATITPGVGPDPDRALEIGVDLGDIAINDLDIHVVDSNVYCSEPECTDCAVEIAGSCLDIGGRCAECYTFCGGLTNGLLAITTGLIDLIRPLLNNLLTPIIDNLLGSTLNSLNGQTAKLQQQVNLGQLLPIPALSNSNAFGIFVAPRPGPFDVIDRGTGDGMEITVSGGAEGTLADCVGDLEDFVVVKGPVPALGGTDSRNRPYHIGFTMAQSLMNEMLYAMHRSGSLCLKLGTKDVRDLTNGQFTLNASLLSLLAADIGKLASDRAPVVLELKPRNAPTITLGTGEKTGVDSMGKDVYDWLLKLQLQELGIAFHVLIQDRYVRVFEVTSDIFVGLNITVLPDNKLQVAVGELRIDNFNQYFNEILPNADFAMVLPTLIEIVMQGLLTQSLTFDLDITNAVSDALGGAPIYLRVNDIMRDGVQQDFLTLSMTFTSSPTANLSLAANTVAELAGDGELVERSIETKLARPTGRVRLAVAGSGLDGRDLEYAVRVDGGVWRTWQTARADGTIVVEDAHLNLPGAHDIEVRSRFVDDYQSLDPTPARVAAVVDYRAPVVSAKKVDALVEIEVRDLETAAGEALTLEARLDDGAWRPVALTESVERFVRQGEELEELRRTARMSSADLGAASTLELRARDARGNESGIASLGLGPRQSNEPIYTPPEEEGCSCHEVPGAPHDHASSWIALALVAALAFLRLRGEKR